MQHWCNNHITLFSESEIYWFRTIDIVHHSIYANVDDNNDDDDDDDDVVDEDDDDDDDEDDDDDDDDEEVIGQDTLSSCHRRHFWPNTSGRLT